MKQYSIHQIIFYFFLFLIPIQTRIIFNSDQANIGSYFSYDLAQFLYLTDVLLIILIVSWGMFHKHKMSVPQLGSILALISLILITLFHVKHLGVGFYQTLKWLELLALTVYIWEQREQLSFRFASFVIWLSAISQSLIGLAQFHVQHSLGLRFLGEYIGFIGSGAATFTIDSGEKLIRSYGTFPHPNVFAGFLILGIVGGFYLLVSHETSKLWHKWIVSCGTVLIFLGLAVSFSRIAWIGAILLFGLVFVYHFRIKSWLNLKFLAIIAIVSCGTIAFLYGSFMWNRAAEPITQSQSLADRQFYNDLGLKVFNQNPILGIGVGNYIPALRDMFDLAFDWQYQPPHNIWIKIAAELGILGAALFAIIILKVLVWAWNKKSDLAVFIFGAGLAVFVAMSMFDHYFVTIQQGQLTFFTLLGLAGAAVYKNEKI